MGIAKGVALGPYEILTHIGAGGMGDVWRARDRRIGRDVAVKVLPEYQEGDARVQRFEQEARAAGALNHPGLVTIFDVGTTEGAPYIVMELLEGETLRDALGSRVPVKKAIDYATQIATALAVAHEKGIIHRDLKPENIFVTSEGRVKILDFGLAKLAEDATDPEGKNRTARHLTSAGMVVGTPGYMSPEQVRAQPLDHRTDIFAFGTVLYEMLTGVSPFERESAVETMNAVLNAEQPPLAEHDPAIPPALDAIVSHCLEKKPQERFQSARDLAFQLRVMAGTQNGATGARNLPARAVRWPYRAALAAAVLLALGAVGGAAWLRGERPDTASRTFRQLTYADGVEAFPVLAPDGKSFAYVSGEPGKRDIYVQRVDGRMAANLTADSSADDAEPAFSPDGSQIAFRSEREGGGIFVMGVTGESVRRLTDFGHNPSWAPDGTRIVVSTAAVELQPSSHLSQGDLLILDARTGAKRTLYDRAAGESDALQPNWSPHGKRIAYWGVTRSSGQRDIWTIDSNAPEPLKTVVRITTDPALHWNPVWSPDGRFLYFGSNRDGTLNLWRVAIDESTGTPEGAPEPLSLPGQISGNFTFSQQGELAFASVTRSYRILAMPFDARTGRTGAPRALFGGSQEIMYFAPSPDGQSIAFTTGGTQEDLFVARTDGSRMRQLTNDAARDRAVTWSPDGRSLYFYSNREGAAHIWRIGVDGGGLTRVTDDTDLKRIGESNVSLPSVSPDGRTLVVQTDRAQAFVHLDRPPAQRLERIDEYVGVPKWSPDGRSLVGVVPNAIVVYSLAARRAETVRAHARSVQWLPGGRRIFFMQDQRIGIFDLDTRKEISAPFTPPPGVSQDFRSVLSRDGATLYVRESLEQGDILLLHPGKTDRDSG